MEHDMDYIVRLAGFRLEAHIGIHDFERRDAQPLLIDVDLQLGLEDGDLGKDTIDTVLDYDFIRDGIKAIVQSRHFDLQETLCAKIHAMCVAQAPVRAARVYLRKINVYPDCASVGVEMGDRTLRA
jgi:dihydroneopterin aldolase